MSYTRHTWVTGEIISKGGLNNIEAGVLANDTAITALQTALAARGLAYEGTVTLTNSQKWPFNNSLKSVSIGHTFDNTDYTVVIKSAVSSDGANVGEVYCTDYGTNAFKMGYTGSAASVTVTYVVIGGFLA